jgi:uncharacterized protein with FMN-binding domain
MRRAAMVAGGAVLGGAAVMALPTPGKPQQVAIAANAGATRHSAKAATHAKKRKTRATARKATTAAPAPTTTTVVGALETTQYGELQVKLTVKGGKITGVGFTTFVANDGRSQSIDQAAAPILIRETIAAQSAQVSAVSGATYTSSAYQQSLQAAIDKAGL